MSREMEKGPGEEGLLTSFTNRSFLWVPVVSQWLATGAAAAAAAAAVAVAVTPVLVLLWRGECI